MLMIFQDKSIFKSNSDIDGYTKDIARDFVRTARKVTGLTQQKFAERMGLTVTRFTRIELCDRGCPTLETLRRVAEAANKKLVITSGGIVFTVSDRQDVRRVARQILHGVMSSGLYQAELVRRTGLGKETLARIQAPIANERDVKSGNYGLKTMVRIAAAAGKKLEIRLGD